jgi:hypothetical protein
MKPDARRLQRNLSYAIHMNCDKTLEDLKKGTTAALEHMFNNHEHCGAWCSHLPKTDAEKRNVNGDTNQRKRMPSYTNSASDNPP